MCLFGLFLKRLLFFFHWPHLLVAAEIQLTGNPLWLVPFASLLEIRLEINSRKNKARKVAISESQHQCNCSDIITLMYFSPFPNTGRIEIFKYQPLTKSQEDATFSVNSSVVSLLRGVRTPPMQSSS